MGRLYPRFIYSTPQDTKSKGPFIVHTLVPQMIAKVSFADNGFHYINALEVFTQTDQQKVNEVIGSMHDWYTSIRMKQANLSEDFYIRVSNIANRISHLKYFQNALITVSMVYSPLMGARIDIAKDNWEISHNMADKDTYEIVVEKLKEAYYNKYQIPCNWPL